MMRDSQCKVKIKEKIVAPVKKKLDAKNKKSELNGITAKISANLGKYWQMWTSIHQEYL